MDRRQVGFPAVVIGGSAGALEALQRVVAELPGDFPAAVFVATHVPPTSVSALPNLLARRGALFATHAIDGAPIAPGIIIVAPPGRHLIVKDGVMRVLDGPKQNNQRPSIDVLFRSAAAEFRSSACAVLLSGTLDDGVAGLAAIHDAGGAAFAQDPSDAVFPEMPRHAIRSGAVDGIYAARDLAQAILDWIAQPRSAPGAIAAPGNDPGAGTLSIFTCSSCGSTLWDAAYDRHCIPCAPEDSLGSAMWRALRALEERHQLLARLSSRSRGNGQSPVRRHLDRQIVAVREDIECVRQAIASLSERTTNAL